MKRMAIVGLDGLPPNILELLIEHFSNKLSFLSDCLSSYTIHKMESTIPYITPPAWVSITTGVNPGKHAIYDFFKLKRVYNGFDLSPVSSYDVKYPCFWNILGKYKLTSLIVNVPPFYPAIPLRGVMISGPPITKLSVFPKYLLPTIKHMGYKVDIDNVGIGLRYDKVNTLKKMINIVHSRIKVCKYLMNKYLYQKY